MADEATVWALSLLEGCVRRTPLSGIDELAGSGEPKDDAGRSWSSELASNALCIDGLPAANVEPEVWEVLAVDEYEVAGLHEALSSKGIRIVLACRRPTQTSLLRRGRQTASSRLRR